MKRNFIVLLSYFLLIGCKNSNQKLQTEEILPVTDYDIYEIVNQILKEHDEAMQKDGFETNPYIYVLDCDWEPLFTKADSIYIFQTDTIFSKVDKMYIGEQINNRKNFKYANENLTSKTIISADTIKAMIEKSPKNSGKSFKERYYEKYENHEFYTIGLPIFSRNKKTVFIKFNSFDHGYTLIYKKVNNKWKYCYQISYWIV